jgi:uncharacterized protein
VRQADVNLPWRAQSLRCARKSAAKSAEKPSSILRAGESGKRGSVNHVFVPAAVLDTNVVLDWLVFGDAGVAPLAQAILSGRLRWLATAAMRDELARMLVHQSLAQWSPNAELALAAFDQHSVHCGLAPVSRLHCSDIDDQGFIDLALAQQARWLITHDRALRKLARRAGKIGVAVVTPELWCAAWQSHLAAARGDMATADDIFR